MQLQRCFSNSTFILLGKPWLSGGLGATGPGGNRCQFSGNICQVPLVADVKKHETLSSRSTDERAGISRDDNTGTQQPWGPLWGSSARRGGHCFSNASARAETALSGGPSCGHPLAWMCQAGWSTLPTGFPPGPSLCTWGLGLGHWFGANVPLSTKLGALLGKISMHGCNVPPVYYQSVVPTFPRTELQRTAVSPGGPDQPPFRGQDLHVPRRKQFHAHSACFLLQSIFP